MHAQLMGPVEGAEHGEVQHAARLLGQALAAPDGAPAILRHQLLHRAVEVVGRGQGLLDELLAQDGFADFEPTLEDLLAHGTLLLVRSVDDGAVYCGVATWGVATWGVATWGVVSGGSSPT